jgi:hypothetical protein
MRLPDFPTVFAFVHAAASTGWKFDFETSTFIATMSERFPALRLVASEASTTKIAQDRLFDWYIGLKSQQPAIDDLAIPYYRSLESTAKSSSEQHYDDGHTMKTEKGLTAAGKAYLYQYATTGFRRIEVFN